MKEGWQAVIGLEIHAQLSTESKIFCGCSTRFGDEPNSNTCPVCLGLPGALPVLNRRAVELGARAALALGLHINEVSIFSRKNYFYPDLPKGYQISQYDRPFSEAGQLEIVTAERDEGGHAREWRPFDVRITRLHLEEDAGKNVHEGLPETGRYSYIDLNRAGTPLAEIVTEPDFRTSWEAYDYVNHVRHALQWVGASDADMEKGNLRCEANVSVRKVGAEKFGTKVELKNLNSVRFMQRAIEFEIERQIALIESGGHVSQETRLWDDRAGETRVMRSKEEAHDYRYFPEPDLQPLTVEADWIEQVRASMPELPDARRKRFMSEYELSFNDASLLVRERALADFYERAAAASSARGAANWLKGELLRELDAANVTADASPVSPEELGALVRAVEEGRISGKQGKDVLAEMFRTSKGAEAVIEEQGLTQLSDAGEIEKIVADVLASNPQQLAAYRDGKEALFGFFVGQVLKASKGKANPKVVNDILKEKLKEG
ncbi:MAG: aspartyl-tRNA(Asn)/glutamyl-tRNA(Gln) amidotransferase subunit [Acidobacteriota bacterium]|jgi:aspartyl-tRNA(Asn)/glutamyl-tRNA(Gln) amidotransferase subunit B|nr:aspartyl-tRNA(Asn)/glutamyl-tRNA(Gln) amidotransferase subunit [Acidobacteriota bacterium]MDT7809061.1 aspartyl-tRNA(Asn)/glutamyl-tRNA(Gln) amidotransferase subunit [Acidobacteriota bacterium]